MNTEKQNDETKTTPSIHKHNNSLYLSGVANALFTLEFTLEGAYEWAYEWAYTDLLGTDISPYTKNFGRPPLHIIAVIFLVAGIVSFIIEIVGKKEVHHDEKGEQ